jgi:hypothetical protein
MVVSGLSRSADYRGPEKAFPACRKRPCQPTPWADAEFFRPIRVPFLPLDCKPGISSASTSFSRLPWREPDLHDPDREGSLRGYTSLNGACEGSASTWRGLHMARGISHMP